MVFVFRVINRNISSIIEYHYIIKFSTVYIVFEIKNAFRTLKALFGLENKNMKPSKKNDVLIDKKSVIRLTQFG